MKWHRTSGAINMLSRIWIFWKFSKISEIFNIFFSFQNFPPQNQNFQKTVLYVRGKWLINMYTKFQVDIFENSWDMTENISKQALFTSFRDLPWLSEFYFLTDFDASKSVLGSFFGFFAKIWPKIMYRSSKSRIFLFAFFYLVTWDDLDLYYGRKAQ